jgi:hypothetical protein
LSEFILKTLKFILQTLKMMIKTLKNPVSEPFFRGTDPCLCGSVSRRFEGSFYSGKGWVEDSVRCGTRRGGSLTSSWCRCNTHLRLQHTSAVATHICGCNTHLRLQHASAVATHICGCIKHLRMHQTSAVASIFCGCNTHSSLGAVATHICSRIVCSLENLYVILHTLSLWRLGSLED